MTDARKEIIQANRGQIRDIRDIRDKLAKTTDTRSKLERIRGQRDGNLEVKQVGGITVTKKLDGKLTLSTKSKSEGGAAGQVTQIGRLTKTVSKSGQVALSSKSARAEAASEASRAGGMRSEARSRSEGRPGEAASVLRGAAGREQKENMRRGGLLSRDIDSLDDELMTARVDPLLLKKTVENSRSRSIGDNRR